MQRALSGILLLTGGACHALTGPADDPLVLDDDTPEDHDRGDDVQGRSGAVRSTPTRKISTKLGNTNSAGGHEFSELDITGAEHEGTWLLSIHYILPGQPVVFPPATPATDFEAEFPILNKEEIATDTLRVIDGELRAEYKSALDGIDDVTGQQWNRTLWKVRLPGPDGLTDYWLTVDHEAVGGGGLGDQTPLYTFYWRPVLINDFTPTCAEAVGDGYYRREAALYRGFDVDDYGARSGQLVAHPDLLVIGCVSGAIGKASLWGYRPDYGPLATHFGGPASTTGPSDPLQAFETVVRMIRADYLGDGQSHTQDGNEVHLQDSLSGSSMALPPSATREARWSLNGAVCLEKSREPWSWAPGGACLPDCSGVTHSLFTTWITAPHAVNACSTPSASCIPNNGLCEALLTGCSSALDYFDCGACPWTDDGICDEPAGTGVCPPSSDSNDCTCPWTQDGVCDDPRWLDLCPLYSDGSDCTCPWTQDGVCDDPRGLNLCPLYSDEDDCTCPWTYDGVCDDPQGTNLCPLHSDSPDCP